MYLSVLVPLDRSPFAEHALPWALTIARRAGARLDLVQVHTLYALDEPGAAWCDFDADQDRRRRADEQLYLDGTAQWLHSVAPVPVSTALLAGSAVLPSTLADSIGERAQAGKNDLIVMATHARDGLERFLVGSVADELVRRGPGPLLLVPPDGKQPDLIPEPRVERVVVPLDGSALAEQALEPGLDLAKLMEASCVLLRVIPPQPHAKTAEEAEARAYLEATIRRLGDQPVHVEGLTVAAQSVPEAILHVARPTDLIALATHGRGGLRRLALGSVADKVIRGAATPVLVCRAAPA